LATGDIREILYQKLWNCAYRPEINYGFVCWLQLFFTSVSILISDQESAADITQREI
jgi:hypothetical protein